MKKTIKQKYYLCVTKLLNLALKKILLKLL